MLKQPWKILTVILILSWNLDKACCSELSGVSWVFRGSAQTNNTALTFNQGDTLNLVCAATGSAITGIPIFMISKGTIPTNATLTSGILTISNIGTLIYSDVDGLQPDFENFAIWGLPLVNIVTLYGAYDYHFVNIATLKTTDSGTYHCSAYRDDPFWSDFYTSGGLTITVNTKASQARSTRTRVNGLLTYSAAIMGASKLLF